MTGSRDALSATLIYELEQVCGRDVTRLRQIIATAGGRLACQDGMASAVSCLRRVADALERQR